MRINCLSCGHKIELDDAYDDFEGPVKCLCGAMLEIRMEEGKLKAIKMAAAISPPGPQPRKMEGAVTG